MHSKHERSARSAKLLYLLIVSLLAVGAAISVATVMSNDSVHDDKAQVQLLPATPYCETPVFDTKEDNPVTTMPPSPAETYTVEPGDTLSEISQELDLPSWQVLLCENPDIDDPNLIQPGQVLDLP